MKYVITKPQLSIFLKRRFSHEDLLWLVNDVKKMIDQGFGVESAVYDGIRQFIKSGELDDIDEFGNEQSYWDSYLKYETPLVAFVKSELGLD
jgi:hypothetical protein